MGKEERRETETATAFNVVFALFMVIVAAAGVSNNAYAGQLTGHDSAITDQVPESSVIRR
jgi:hypothetical protein